MASVNATDSLQRLRPDRRMTMRKLSFAAVLLALGIWPTTAQTPTPFPQTLNANTVVGRIGIGAGPSQQIPFTVLNSNLFTPRTEVADANYTVVATDTEIAYTSITVARTVALLPATQYRKGQTVCIRDVAGNASVSRTLSVAPNGTDTINGSNATTLVVQAAYGGVCLESNGVGAWTFQPANVVTIAGAPPTPQGRLTLQSNTPVMTTSQATKTQIYYDCYVGSQVPYFDGSVDQIESIPSCEVSTTMIAGAATAGGDNTTSGGINNNDNYDIWWVHAGTNRVCLATSGAAAHSGGGWSQDAGSLTARGTGFSQLDKTTRGYVTNKNSITNCWNGPNNYGPVSANRATYLGTTYTFAAGTTAHVFGAVGANWNPGAFYIWNMYNRVLVETFLGDSTDSWTYAVATTWRAANSNANARVSFVRGLDEEAIDAVYSAISTPGSVTVAVAGVGLDTTTNFTGTTYSNSTGPNGIARYSGLPGAGLHFVSANEFNSTTTSSTWFGDSGVTYLQSGMHVNLGKM